MLESVHDAIKSFSAPEFRLNPNGMSQKEIIESVAKAYLDGTKVVYLQSPTGTGKSLMLMAIANGFAGQEDLSDENDPVGRAFYTTPQILLLDQIQNDPLLGSRTSIIKGRSNYKCVHPKTSDKTCDRGLCVTKSGFECEYKELMKCPYYTAKAKAKLAQTATMSFMYFLVENMYARGMGERELIVIDEAHTIEHWVLNNVGIRLSKKELPDNYTFDKVKDCKRAGDVVPFLEEIGSIYHVKWHELDNLEFRSDEVQSYYEALGKMYKKIKFFIDDFNEGNLWVFQIEGDSLLLQPVTVGRFMEKYLWGRGEYFLLASGTILDPGLFSRCIGIQDRGYKLIDVPSPFPHENNQIYNASTGKLTKMEIDKHFDSTMLTLDYIMHREHGKGLIHCHSYALAERIWNASYRPWRDRLLMHDSTDRMAVLTHWMKDSPDLGTVLLSVNMTEGLNLPGDMCTFQVLFKTAYPFLGDKRVSVRISTGDGKLWYNQHAIQHLIQSNGRAIRSEDDKANYYIMDASAIALLRRNFRNIPKWFNELMRNMIRIDMRDGKYTEVRKVNVW